MTNPETAGVEPVARGVIAKAIDSYIGDTFGSNEMAGVVIAELSMHGMSIAAHPAPAFNTTSVGDVERVARAAKAIWAIQREDLDKCDLELDDVGDYYDTFKIAKAALDTLAHKEASDGTA